MGKTIRDINTSAEDLRSNCRDQAAIDPNSKTDE